MNVQRECQTLACVSCNLEEVDRTCLLERWVANMEPGKAQYKLDDEESVTQQDLYVLSDRSPSLDTAPTKTPGCQHSRGHVEDVADDELGTEDEEHGSLER